MEAVIASCLEPQLLESEEGEEKYDTSSDSEVAIERPRKRARAVISHVRECQRVHPSSVYHGTDAHSKGLHARSEREILNDFLVHVLERN